MLIFRQLFDTVSSTYTYLLGDSGEAVLIDPVYEHVRRDLALLRERGVKVGLRYTMTAMNAHDIPPLLEMMRRERVNKFYFSHLNYAGRGNIHRCKDAQFQSTREALDRLYDRAWLAARGQALLQFNSTAYSDSINDLPLLRAVKHPVMVDPDPQLAAIGRDAGWPMLSLH